MATGAGKTITAIYRLLKLTRAKRWEQQDEEESYTGKRLDDKTVNPDQIRTVIRAFRDQLPATSYQKFSRAGSMRTASTRFQRR